MVDGFPFGKDYYGIVLAVTENESKELVLICRNMSHIDIIDINNNIISIPSLDTDSDIMIINGYLTDGLRFYNLTSDDSLFIGEIRYLAKR